MQNTCIIDRHSRYQVGERNHEGMQVVEFDEAEITYVMNRFVRARLAYHIERIQPFILHSVSRMLIQALMLLSA